MYQEFKLVSLQDIPARGDKKGLVVLAVPNHAKGIAREPKQFLIDLQNSGILPTSVTSIQHPAYQQAVMDFKRGLYRGYVVTGDLKYNNIGDKFVLGANHPEVLDKNSKAKAGDVREATSEGFWVEGFLSLQPSDSLANAMILAREARKEQLAQNFMSNPFGNVEVPTASIPDAVADAVGAPDDAI